MEAARFALVEAAFHRASQVSGEARARTLAEICGDDHELRRELDELLAAAEREAPALDRPAGAFFGDAMPREEVPGYRLLRQIGRGGSSIVYLAEQQGEGFSRRVALKIVNWEQDPAFVRRFRVERRILAGLEHPGIARLYDAGITPSGRSYLAMELVEGENLLEYCRRTPAALRTRIELFLGVLEAVGYAHAANVVHRDLKPANILVSERGEPKLLDFGIARLHEDGGLETTHTLHRAMTPAYASPEQVRGKAVDARSDIYSLGVVLYELLAGRRPYRLADTSRETLERAIREQEPDRPSTAVVAEGDSADKGTTGGTWTDRTRRRELRGDLDAILLKALRKEPGARYASAADFAADLRCHLEGKPVRARRGSLPYRLGKVARRRRGVLVNLALVAVLVTGAWLWAPRRVEHNAQPPDPPPRPFPFSSGNAPPIEELERRFHSAPSSVEAGAALALALEREGRRKEADLIVVRLRQIPDKAEAPLTDYVEATFAAADKQPQRALVLHTRALENAVAQGRGELVAQIRASRGRLLAVLGRREEARREMEAARAAFVAAGDQASLARVLNDLAVEYAQAGEIEEAERMLEAALVATRAASPNNRGATFLGNLATLAQMRGRPDLAETRLREAIAVFREIQRPARLGSMLMALASVLHELGRPQEAREALEEALSILRREDAQNNNLAGALYARGSADLDAGKLDRIEATATEIDAAAQASARQLDLAVAEALRGQLAAARGDAASARQHLTEAHRLFAESGETDSLTQVALLRAEVELEAGHPAEAARLAAEAVARWRGHGANWAVFKADTLLARIDAAAGRTASARRRLESLGPGAERSPSAYLRLDFFAARAEIFRAEGSLPQARRDLETAIALAGTSELKVDEFRLRLMLAEVNRRGGAATARDAATSIATEAARLGLHGIAARARRLAGELL
jgi:eukaryotic-like serine/threonine-protein kinase